MDAVFYEVKSEAYPYQEPQYMMQQPEPMQRRVSEAGRPYMPNNYFEQLRLENNAFERS